MNKIIDIEVSKSYKVHLGHENYKDIVQYVDGGKKVFIITDENLEKLHLKELTTILDKEDINYFKFVLKPGEDSKSLEVVERIMNAMAAQKMSRSDIVIAFGGGVVGDIAGFCASIYQRGVEYIQIPTTLLAAVDSSVGGKTAVNLKSGKNLVGSFKQPLAVLCNLDTFKTLSKEEFNNGVYECIKYGILFEREYFNIFLQEDFDVNSNRLLEVVERAIEFKAKVVIEDEFDFGMRRLLNLGHTFGHGIEQASNYKIKHGFAVGLGMEIVSKISRSLNEITEEELEEILAVMKKYRNIKLPTISSQDILSYVLVDKKIYDGVINMIIPKSIGECEIKEVELDKLKELYYLGTNNS
ncbi:3-dehydroquinate synthase [Mediannikoviicoccus vaginalis]|uniref:3-dehydroquinate synthase n=1 Tax=Mediannikoviicoccus vaginalis TaxID=2899727 RepID=UPI001F00D6FC|nr:3-dehydroquinate synthase [Mediannikoviicoccus vaginalis]